MKKMLRQAMKKYMHEKKKKENRAVSTHELIDYINAHYASGTTISEIINLLGKDKEIKRAEDMRIRGRKYGSYKGQAWTVALDWEPLKRGNEKTKTRERNCDAHRDLAKRRESRRQILMKRETEPCNLKQKQQPEEPERTSNNPSSL